MRKIFFYLFLFFLAFFQYTYADTLSVSVTPETIIQGDPVLVVISGLVSTSTTPELTFDGKKIPVFMYQAKPTALIGIDIHKTPGTYNLVLKTRDGATVTNKLVVNEREKIEQPMGIPEKLGGNTVQSQNTMVSSLAQENALLANLPTGKKAFWTEPFRFPLEKIFVTDIYGYSRKTGEYNLTHKGTDFRATEGTPVYAMNRGVVRVSREGRNYGKTIVVDHGLGVMTFYLHLSKIKVYTGQLVTKSQIIGLSGQTGYVDAPHLHLSIRINNTSINPVEFMKFFAN